MVHSYSFTLNQTNQSKTGFTESETHFEGIVKYAAGDDLTGMELIEVDAFLTGFTQYQNGAVVFECKDIKVPAESVVKNWKDFERACVDRAFFEAELRLTKLAA